MLCYVSNDPAALPTSLLLLLPPSCVGVLGCGVTAKPALQLASQPPRPSMENRSNGGGRGLREYQEYLLPFSSQPWQPACSTTAHLTQRGVCLYCPLPFQLLYLPVKLRWEKENYAYILLITYLSLEKMDNKVVVFCKVGKVNAYLCLC